MAVGAAAVLVLLVGAVTGAGPSPSTSAGPLRVSSDDFVGAEACGECHREQYDAWSTSTHGEAGGEPSPATLIAPFDGTPVAFADAEVVPAVDSDGRYVFTVRRPGRPDDHYEVVGVIGKGHMRGGGTQGFLTAMADGTRRFLPFDFSARLGRWFCNTGNIAGWWVSGGGHGDLRPDRGWLPITEETKLTDCGDWPPIRVLGTDARHANCQQCHGSQITLAFDTAAHRYRSGATSLRVNCESCHGPGKRHAELARRGALDASAAILAPDTLDRAGSMVVCLQCHALKRQLGGAFLSGDTLAARYSLGLPLLGADRPLLPDGKVRTFAYQGGHLYSACWYGGGMTCVDCHEPHGPGYRDVFRRPLDDPLDDGQCLGCHASKADDPPAHTHHAAGSEGARCVSCHMPYRQQPGLGDAIPYARSDHTISIPRPGVDEADGVPSACALCHADRATAVLAADVRRWYGELAPRPRLLERVAKVRAAPDGSWPADVPPEAMVDLEEARRLPLAQVAALNELFLRWMRPDAGTDAVDAAETPVVTALQRLAGGLLDGRADGTPLSTDVAGAYADVSGVALALLHLGWGDVPAVRAWLDARSGAMRPQAGGVTARWGRALQLMGDAWRTRGRMEDALRAFARAQEVLPGDASILLDLASTYTALGRYDESLPYYVRAIRIAPAQTVAMVNLGLTLEAMGREAEAEGAYRRAVATDPSEAVAHLNLGNIHLRRGETAEAAAAYREALRWDPGLARAAFYLAVALVQSNDLEGARAALLDARTFAPGDEEVAQLLERVEEALGGR